MKELCTNCFKNLGIKSRIKIYNFIQVNKKATVAEVTDFIKLKQPTVSYHLKNMHESGLLNRVELGKQVFYSVNTKCPHDYDYCVLSLENKLHVKNS